MAELQMQGFMDSTLKNLKSMVDVNTIVGEPVTSEDGTIIIPVSTVGFGFGLGGCDFGIKKDAQTENAAGFGGGCGGGVSIKPTAFLVVNSNGVKLLPMTGSSTTADKIMDLVPDMIEKVNSVFSKMSDKSKAKKEEVDKTVNVIDLDD